MYCGHVIGAGATCWIFAQVKEDGPTMSCWAFAKASVGFDPENRGRLGLGPGDQLAYQMMGATPAGRGYQHVPLVSEFFMALIQVGEFFYGRKIQVSELL